MVRIALCRQHALHDMDLERDDPRSIGNHQSDLKCANDQMGQGGCGLSRDRQWEERDYVLEERRDDIGVRLPLSR